MQQSEQKNEYETRVVCFIDILGWKNAIYRTEEDIEFFQLLSKISLELSNFSLDELFGYPLQSGQKNFLSRTTHFSDSLIVSTPTNQRSEYLIPQLCALQCYFLSEGFLVRGGITCGLLYHKDSTVFGPALIKAYEIESKLSILPRIVIDPSATEVIKNIYDLSTDLIGIDRDGQIFLNYFHLFWSSIGNDNMSKCRKRILEGLDRTQNRPNDFLKWQWTAELFNQMHKIHRTSQIIAFPV